jgi:hypothetical protein
MRHAIVNQNNEVVNVVIWNGAEWLPPRGHLVVQNDTVGIGDIYDPQTNTFTRPVQGEEDAS